MQLMEKVMEVPLGILLKHMSLEELCELLNAAITQGIITGKRKAIEKIQEMPNASIIEDNIGIN